MNNFNVIYKILKKLEESMDTNDFDAKQINHETLGITEMRWNRIIQMLIENNLIGGVKILSADNNPFYGVRFYNAHITLKGLEYLENNSTMAKIHKTLKGIKEITPMI